MKHSSVMWAIKDMRHVGVKSCACGLVHVQFGPTMLNFTKDVFVEMVSHFEQVISSESKPAALPDNVIQIRH